MHRVTANGASIPAIGLGTWRLRDAECAALVEHALRTGYRHIDTAAMYDNEGPVGQGIRASGVARDDIFVTTKVWYTDIDDGKLQASAEASLKRLGLDQIDLLLIHWPNRDVPLSRSIKALVDAKRRGLARNIGVSNFPSAMLREAAHLSAEPICVNQCEYHPQLAQTAVLEACRDIGAALTSYCPLGRGALVDHPTVRSIAAAQGRTPGQVLLRWHVQQPGVIAIPKSATPSRIEENLAIFDFALSEVEMAALHALARPDGRVVNMAWAPDWDQA